MGRSIKQGSTGQGTTFRALDSAGAPVTTLTAASAGLALRYRRTGGSLVTITPSDLASVTAAHSAGGMIHTHAGYYRLDLADAAVAAGAEQVEVTGVVTGATILGDCHPLVAFDPQDAVRLGLTSLPNANASASGGLPTVDASNRVKANVEQVAGQTANAAAAVTFPASIGTSTYAGADTAGTTTLLSRIGSALTITGGKVDVNDKTGFALTTSQVDVIVGAIESEIANDATGEAIKQAIVDKLIENLPDLDDLTLAAIGNAARDAVLDRVLAGNHDAAGSVGKLLQSVSEARLAELDAGNLPADLDALKARLTSDRAGYLDNLSGGAVALAGSAPGWFTGFATAAQGAAAAATAAKLDTALELNAGNYRFTVAALVNAPAGEGGGGTAPTAEEVADEVESRLGAGQVELTSPVTAGGDVALTVNDSYPSARVTPITLADAGGTWPDLTGATVKLNVGGLVAVTGTVAGAGTDDQSVTFEPTAAQTALLTVDAGRDRKVYRFDVRATWADTPANAATIHRGKATVYPSEAPAS